STTLNIWRKSKMETLGNLVTSSCCKAAEACSLGTFVVITLNCGAFSSTPFGNNILKKGCILLLSINLMLPTTVFTKTPCTLKVMSSPTATLVSSAKSALTETGTILPGVACGVNVPACKVSEAISE